MPPKASESGSRIKPKPPMLFKSSKSATEIIVIDLEAYVYEKADSADRHLKRQEKLEDPQRRWHCVWEFAASNMSGTFEFSRFVRSTHSPTEEEQRSLYPWKNARSRGVCLTDASQQCFEDIWKEFVAHINSLDIDPIFVAHNGYKHDFPVLKTEFLRCFSYAPNIKILDSILLFERIFDSASYSKDELYLQTFGSQQPQNHEAVADVRGLIKLISVFMGRMGHDFKRFTDFCFIVSITLNALTFEPEPMPLLETKQEIQYVTKKEKKKAEEESRKLCPDCARYTSVEGYREGYLIERQNRWTREVFFGCSNFPRCDYTE